MKPIASILAVAASVALAVGLIILLAMHVPVTPSMTGTEADATAAQDPSIALPSIATSDLARRVKTGGIRSIEVVDQHAIITTEDGQQRFIVSISPGTNLPEVLLRFGVTPDELVSVDYIVQDSALGAALGSVVLIVTLLMLVLAVALYITRDAGKQSTVFAKSGARLSTGTDEPGVRFADVAGVDEAVQELEEVVEFLKHPDKFSALGARIPRGVLLVGPPGTGKTLLARAIAGEAGVPFFSIAGSAFVEMFAGVGASRVRDLFAQAKSKAPCMVFVDEIDAVGRQRGTGRGGDNDEREQTLNQLLVEMDGFDSSTNVIVIGATNRPDVLDSALVRPGRFDRRVMLPAPDSASRSAILQVHARGKPLDDSIDSATLAGLTPGLSGAQVANLINESAILAVCGNKQTIGMPELQQAIDRAVAGPQRKSRVMSEREKVLTAYHEAGHAVVGRFVPNHDPLHGISIINRGMLGGHTRFLPAEDRHYLNRSQLSAMLASALGGQAAELMVFGEISTSARDDIQTATNIARRMVTEYGMSERLGPVGARNEYSDKMAEAVDDEIRCLVDAASARAQSIIAEHRDVVVRLAQALVQKESLVGSDLERIFRRDLESRPEPTRLPSHSEESAA
jgi:cell division protease FtsH